MVSQRMVLIGASSVPLLLGLYALALMRRRLRDAREADQDDDSGSAYILREDAGWNLWFGMVFLAVGAVVLLCGVLGHDA